MIRYVSTRGAAPALEFEDAVLSGLASDGGLYVPERIPAFSPAEIASLRGLSYPELAVRVMEPFVGGFDRGALRRIVNEAYGEFRHEAVAPLKQLDRGEWLLELFHGPTLAFKDFALQFLGRLLDDLLRARKERVVILGATSGDTGSAAIAGCGGRANMDIVILHPRGRVSDVQRRQMTSVTDANVHNIAIEGTFDDCQDLVKALFNDVAFRTAHKLAAVNSINWARILAQVVYYFYAALALGAPATRVSFSVPTGNFGDIYAGYVARRMGLPIERLIIASNRNDILTRCLATGTYGIESVTPSLSPSMDIQISSNFERLLFDLFERDGAAVASLMQRFRTDQSFTLSPSQHHRLRELFAAERASDEDTLATIRLVYDRTGEVLDPHTAVGVFAGRACHKEASVPLVTLATAHPAKFPDAVKKGCGVSPALPAHLSDLLSRPEKMQSLPNDQDALKRYIEGIA